MTSPGCSTVRPDLLHPVPSDVDVLANRATGRASVEIALDRLDVATLHVVEAFALLPAPTDAAAVASCLGVTVRALPPRSPGCGRRCWCGVRTTRCGSPPGVRDSMPTPANLGPPVRVLLEHLPAGRLARLVA